MRILVIGAHNLLNDVLFKILSRNEGYEVYFVTPEEVKHQHFSYDVPTYKLSIVDLNSSTDGEANFVKEVKRKNISEKQIILYSNSNEMNDEQLINVGADHCLSVESHNIEDLLHAIDEVGEN